MEDGWDSITKKNTKQLKFCAVSFCYLFIAGAEDEIPVSEYIRI